MPNTFTAYARLSMTRPEKLVRFALTRFKINVEGTQHIFVVLAISNALQSDIAPQEQVMTLKDLIKIGLGM